MVKQRIFKSNELPDVLKWQILSFLRIQWPDGFVGKNKLRDWVIKGEWHPLHFVLVEENSLLVSYLGVVWKYLKHRSVNYKTYGLSGVFTNPSFRRQGHGARLVKSAKAYIEKSGGDIALFPSTQKGFYEKAGFRRMEKVKLLKGNPSQPEEVKENEFMLFLSDKGKKGRTDFVIKPVYFGEDTW